VHGSLLLRLAWNMQVRDAPGRHAEFGKLPGQDYHGLLPIIIGGFARFLLVAILQLIRVKHGSVFLIDSDAWRVQNFTGVARGKQFRFREASASTPLTRG